MTAGLQSCESLEVSEIRLHRCKGEVKIRGSVLVVLLATACLVATWSFVTSAQVIDSNPCEQSCYEQKSMCVSACGAHTNPVECGAQWHDPLLDCLKECR